MSSSTDLLHGAGHLAVPAQVVEEHEAGIEIDAFEDVVGDHHFEKGLGRPVLTEEVVDVADELVAGEEMLILLPLIEHLGALVRGADGVQHIAVTLRVDRLLIGLDVEAEVDLVGGDIFTDAGKVCGLYGVQKHQETQHLVIRPALCGSERLAVVLDVLIHVDFFRDPEVVHRLAVPRTRPGIFEVVEVVEVGGVAADHAALGHFDVAVLVEEGLHFKIMFFHNSSECCFYIVVLCCSTLHFVATRLCAR